MAPLDGCSLKSQEEGFGFRVNSKARLALVIRTMLATERLLEIESEFGSSVQRVICIELDEESIRLVLDLKDGTNLRVAEQWKGNLLERYSYYWLDKNNKLIIGWDNAPHHTKLDTYPNHKHVGKQNNLQISQETSLVDVMEVIFGIK